MSLINKHLRVPDTSDTWDYQNPPPEETAELECAIWYKSTIAKSNRLPIKLTR